MRLLNHGEIKVGDWIEWTHNGKTWNVSETPVCHIGPLDWNPDGKVFVWWDSKLCAWPIKDCRKVKGPDETTERASGQAGAEV